MDEIIPISDLQTRAKQIIERVSRTRDRVVITQRGRPTALLVSFEDYEGLVATVEEMSEPDWRERLAEAEKDTRARRGTALQTWKARRARRGKKR